MLKIWQGHDPLAHTLAMPTVR